MADKATIKIPRNLYNKLKEITDETGFNSVTEFIVYVMRDLVSTKELNRDEGEEIDGEELSSEEVNMIRKRLKSLGYLD
ncbi:MAG TPA: CopG family transcriptional regulator [Halanaerobiales bacterium]|nr:CopG family transcriptional regulator [Halanaerobiales bacterium]